MYVRLYDKTQFVEIDNIRIAYIETNANASQTIFFIHGNSLNKSVWDKQLNSSLLLHYRLVAFDLPGCGESGRAVNYAEDYTIKNLAHIAATFITTLAQQKPYIITGLSLGSVILAEMLPDVQPSGIAIVSSCIVGEGINLNAIAKPNTHVSVVFTEGAAKEYVMSYAHETMINATENDIEAFTESYYTTDKNLRKTLTDCVLKNNFSDEIIIVQQKNVPTLVVFGKDEKVLDQNYLDEISLPLWNEKIYKINGASHLVNVDRPDDFNKLLSEFAGEVFK